MRRSIVMAWVLIVSRRHAIKLGSGYVAHVRSGQGLVCQSHQRLFVGPAVGVE